MRVAPFSLETQVLFHFLELPDSSSEPLSNFRELLGAKEKEEDDTDHNQFTRSKTKHYFLS